MQVDRCTGRKRGGENRREGVADIEGMNGTTALRRVVGGAGGGGAGGQELPPIVTLVVYKDDAGYGMKVSGDNPVYVQSVKEGKLINIKAKNN